MTTFKDLDSKKGGVTKADFEVIKEAFSNGTYVEDRAYFHELLYSAYNTQFYMGVKAFVNVYKKQRSDSVSNTYLDALLKTIEKKTPYDLIMLAECVNPGREDTHVRRSELDIVESVRSPDEYIKMLEVQGIGGIISMIESVFVFKNNR